MRIQTLVALLVCVCASVAGASAAVVRGVVVDPDGESLPGARVTLRNERDTAKIVADGVTNLNGRFSLRDVPAGTYALRVAFMGYANLQKQVKVSGSTVDLDTLRLSQSSIELAGVTVRGVATQIKVKEDTIEFNADSYRTQPNAVVEDLLKRLPGVDVGSDGSITANGQTVTKILVDGKEFFSDDPKVASKNLPVDMVDRLQVVNRKSDLARMTGVDDGEEETVINLTVKKNMKNGYFGTLEGGYGTQGRYMGSFNLNRFWNDNQITFLGNFNNINQEGFTDSSGNRFRRFGGTNGITTSNAFGVNFNVGNQEIFRVGGNVMISHTDRESITRQEREYIFTDSASYATIGKYARDRGYNIRADFRMLWKPDSLNTLELRPNFSYNHNRSTSVDSTLNRAGDPLRTLVSRAFNDVGSRGHALEFGLNAIYNHNFASRPGRSFSIQARYQYSNTRESEESYALNRFFNFGDSLDLYDQYTGNHTWSNMAQGRLTWTEPLGDASNGHFITLAYRAQYRWNNADKMVYDHPLLPEFGPDGIPMVDYSQLVLNDTLSNQFRNNFFNQDIRLGYRYVSRKHNLNIGVSLVPSSSKSINLTNPDRTVPMRHVLNVAPFLRYRLKFSQSRSLNMHYRGQSSQPSMTQLQPVADYSDPMRVVIGNPSLDPSFTHYFRMRFQDFNADAQRSIMVMSDFDMTQNSIVSYTQFDPGTGAQTIRYRNVNGVWSGRLMGMFSQPLRNKAWQVTVHSFMMYNQRIGFNNAQRNRSGSFMWHLRPSLAFRPDNLEFELRPLYGLQYTHNTLGATTTAVHNFGGTFSAYYRTPIGVILSSDLTYTATRGYSQGYDKNEWMWNAQIAYELLSSRSLTLAVKAYDLLQQRSNVSRTITANYIDDISYNDLTRYFMFTVSWKFNTFGKGNQPTDRNAWGGPGGHPGPPPGRGPR